jgi:hypothetical protein
MGGVRGIIGIPRHRPKRITPFPGSAFGECSNDDIVQIARHVDKAQFCNWPPDHSPG